MTFEAGFDVSAGLRLMRLNDVRNQLSRWSRKDCRVEERRNMVTYSMLELAYSFPKRCFDLAKGIEASLAHEQLVPAVILARALVETTAMGCLYIATMDKQIRLRNVVKLEREFLRFYAGSTAPGAPYKAVHVNDALRHLEDLDIKYVAYLVAKHPKGWEEMEGDPVEAFRGPVSVRGIYDNLSEIAHPNGLGTQFLYPASDAFDTASVRARYSFLCSASIWQTQHLLKALASTADMEERFANAFPDTSTFSQPPPTAE